MGSLQRDNTQSKQKSPSATALGTAAIEFMGTSPATILRETRRITVRLCTRSISRREVAADYVLLTYNLTRLESSARRPARHVTWKKKLKTNAAAAYRANALTTGMSDRLPMKKHAVSASVAMKTDGPISPNTRPTWSAVATAVSPSPLSSCAFVC